MLPMKEKQIDNMIWPDAALIDEYEAPPDRLQRDLLAFVERLNGKGLLSVE